MLRTLSLAVFVLLSTPALAEDAGATDAGTPTITMSEVVIKGSVDAGVPEVVDAGVPVAIPADPAAAVSMVKTIFVAVKEGNWWLAASALLVLVVGLLRTLGKKFHEWLPDNNILDKPLIFLYDTKVGGWLLNWLTALAGGVGTAMAAGVHVDWSLWKSVLMISTSASAVLELVKDITAWVKTKFKKADPPAPAPAPAPTEPPKA